MNWKTQRNSCKYAKWNVGFQTQMSLQSLHTLSTVPSYGIGGYKRNKNKNQKTITTTFKRFSLNLLFDLRL